MHTYLHRLFIACVVAGLCVPFAAGQCEDRDGKDHPLISRYPGSCIYTYAQVAFEEFTLPLGKIAGGKFAKSQHLEGKITSIEYNMPEKRSVLEVFRNYETGLKQGGFEILYSCAASDCASGSVGDAPPLYGGGGDRYEPNWEGNQLRYLSAKLSRPAGDVYAALSVVNPYGDAVTGYLYVVEVKPMETGLVTVNAAALESGLARSGHVEVSGILFDFNKSDVKPESKPALEEVAKMLKAKGSMKVWVVGHTDNVGTLEANMKLSEARAAAVAKFLVAGYGIDAARLKGYGVGPLAPVASNESEEGRAKNRRVELVKQ